MSRQWFYRRLESHCGLRPLRRWAEVVTLTDNAPAPWPTHASDQRRLGVLQLRASSNRLKAEKRFLIPVRSVTFPNTPKHSDLEMLFLNDP